MGVRVTLDSTLLGDTPRGWDKAKIVTKRDMQLRGILLTYTTDLEFWGDGFDYIDGVLNQDYCQVIEVTIETDDCQAGVWIEEFRGTIQLTRLSKYDVTQRIITTKILDESFDAKIRNNKSIKAFVDVGTSKNGVNIQAVNKTDIQVFNPTTGTAFNAYLGTTRKMYRVFDCFRFIIDYMTDGQVGFKSDLFSGKYTHWYLCNGKELRVGGDNGNQLEVSFKELFLELHKKTNLSFAIEPTPTGYTDLFQLRLEETSFFEQDDAILTLSNVRDIIMNFNRQELFSHVEIGSTTDFDDKVLSYPPLNFKAFREENYTILGQCNIDKALKLVSKYIIDSNIIEDSLVNNADKYDKETFLIVTDGTKAIKYKEYDTPVSSGTDDAGTAFRLTDSTADFNADGVVAGDMAVNMLTGLTANVNSVDAGGTFCILDTDIYNNGDEYQVRASPFNYNDPLTNVRVIARFLGGLPNSVIKHLTGASTATFQAAITTDVVDTVFPVTINPVEYDDDSTPPNFDSGNNYDTTLFRYTVPSSGLYGFEARAALRLNGQLDTIERIINGDFSAGSANWTFHSSGATITTNYSHTHGGVGLSQLFLKQYFNFQAGNVYVLTYECVISCGAITFPQIYTSGDTYTTTSGTKTIFIDLRNVTTAQLSQQGYNFIQFKFETVLGQTCLDGSKVTIDNVSMVTTPRLDVTQTIQRKTSGGVVLQSFSTTQDFSFSPNEFQILAPLVTQQTFSTFLNEIIDVRIDVNYESGANTQHTLLVSYQDFNTGNVFKTDFRTISVDDGGGDILPVDPDTFPIYKYKFEKAVTFAEFKALKDAPEKAVEFSKNSTNHLFAWRNKITYDKKTGNAEWELRSKTKINGDC